MEVYFSCCLILPSNPAPQYVVQPSPKIHTQQQQQKQAYLLHHPASQSPVILKYWLIWECHTRIFSWSAQREHGGSLLIKLSAIGQEVLKSAVSSGVMR